MTLPVAPNYIAMTQVSVELGRAGGATTSLNEAIVRSLAQVGGAGTIISMSSLRGKSAYTPMVVNGVNGYEWVNTGGAAGTAYCYPRVTVSLGSGGYTFSWTVTSNPNAMTLGSAMSQTCSMRRGYTRSMNARWSATLQCIITDSTGHTITITGISAVLEIENGQ